MGPPFRSRGPCCVHLYGQWRKRGTEISDRRYINQDKGPAGWGSVHLCGLGYKRAAYWAWSGGNVDYRGGWPWRCWRCWRWPGPTLIVMVVVKWPDGLPMPFCWIRLPLNRWQRWSWSNRPPETWPAGFIGYPSGERPLGVRSEVFDLSGFSALESGRLKNRKAEQQQGVQALVWRDRQALEYVFQVLPGIDGELFACLGEVGQNRQGLAAAVWAEEQLGVLLSMAQLPLVELASNASHFPMVQGVIHHLYQSPFL